MFQRWRQSISLKITGASNGPSAPASDAHQQQEPLPAVVSREIVVELFQRYQTEVNRAEKVRRRVHEHGEAADRSNILDLCV